MALVALMQLPEYPYRKSLSITWTLQPPRGWRAMLGHSAPSLLIETLVISPGRKIKMLAKVGVYLKMTQFIFSNWDYVPCET